MEFATDSFFFFKHFLQNNKPPHWKTGYKVEEYLYASIVSTWGALKMRTDLYWHPKKLVPDFLVPLTFKLDRGFFVGEFLLFCEKDSRGLGRWRFFSLKSVFI